MRGYSQLRLGRQSIENQVYLLTFTTHKRVEYFAKWENAKLLSQCIESESIFKRSNILCWVVMPDHVHILMQLGNSDTTSNYIRRLKAGVKRQLPINDQLWAKGFHDRAIRKESDLLPAARYIVANPLRAGLVKSVKDYPFWNSVWL
ncbi:transposase [Thalassolituus sp.]|uniref:REP-associated tyrosine transposase n=1 Tax=Thalassolituus sp. TaxID=2030822 RepID=UPI0035161CB3